MSDDYLWDKTGPPDPEVERLEALLGTLRHEDTPLELPPERPAPRWPLALAAAAAVFVVAMAGWIVLNAGPDTVHPVVIAPDNHGWSVETLAGVPNVEGTPLETGTLSVGQWLETGAEDSARITIADIGNATIGPDTKLRIKKTGAREHRIEMTRGRFEARVDAPPRLFVVETPAATAVDLGCVYTLEVREDGGSALQVSSGAVSMERDDANAFVPEGARLDTDPINGPGVPWFEDAAPELIEALGGLGSAWGTNPGLRTVIVEARRKDSLSLFHLLPRVSPDQRGALYDRLVELAPDAVPEGVHRADIKALDDKDMARWKRALIPVWFE